MSGAGNRWHTVDYRQLTDDGWTRFGSCSQPFVLTVRGWVMIDLFEARTFGHIGYLDCILTAATILDSAVGPPVTRLPFSNGFRRTFPEQSRAFHDLRRHHSVGFFIEKAFRNRGGKGIWNLDVLLMVLAMEISAQNGRPLFTVRPTGDRADYYRRKFGASPLLHTEEPPARTIDWMRLKTTLPVLRTVEIAGRTVMIRVKDAADP